MVLGNSHVWLGVFSSWVVFSGLSGNVTSIRRPLVGKVAVQVNGKFPNLDKYGVPIALLKLERLYPQI